MPPAFRQPLLEQPRRPVELTQVTRDSGSRGQCGEAPQVVFWIVLGDDRFDAPGLGGVAPAQGARCPATEVVGMGRQRALRSPEGSGLFGQCAGLVVLAGYFVEVGQPPGAGMGIHRLGELPLLLDPLFPALGLFVVAVAHQLVIGPQHEADALPLAPGLRPPFIDDPPKLLHATERRERPLDEERGRIVHLLERLQFLLEAAQDVQRDGHLQPIAARDIARGIDVAENFESLGVATDGEGGIRVLEGVAPGEQPGGPPVGLVGAHPAAVPEGVQGVEMMARGHGKHGPALPQDPEDRVRARSGPGGRAKNVNPLEHREEEVAIEIHRPPVMRPRAGIILLGVAVESRQVFPVGRVRRDMAERFAQRGVGGHGHEPQHPLAQGLHAAEDVRVRGHPRLHRAHQLAALIRHSRPQPEGVTQPLVAP